MTTDDGTAPPTELQRALDEQERAWRERPALRRQYADFYARIVRRLSGVPGQTVELGSGIGRFKELRPDVVTTDVEPTRWSDAVVDAHELPFGDASLANLVLLDVFHHLAAPGALPRRGSTRLSRPAAGS